MKKDVNPEKLDDFIKSVNKKPKINSRTKGSSFERALAKKLNTRFNTKEFCRTPGSGAFGTTHALPRYLKVYGDLITPEAFKYVIEAKRGYNIQLEDIWKKNSTLYSFIKQAKKDGVASEKPWLLIYKKDRQKEIVITETKFPLQEELLFKNTYYVYLLEDFLSLGDENFFEDLM
jgi:hypothetical protein